MPLDREETARFKTNSNTKPCNSLETLKKVCDCDLDPVTFMLKLDLDIKTYLPKVRSICKIDQKL